MGGECFLHFCCIKSIDLERYQEMLVSLDKESLILEHASIIWFAENEYKETNVFVEFSYSCSRHIHHRHHEGKASWKLYWNPLLVQPKDLLNSDVHGRCIPKKIAVALAPIWKKMDKVIPEALKIYVDYDPDNGDVVPGFGDYFDSIDW